MIFCLAAGFITSYPILIIPKGELELLINHHHLPILDVFFKYVTHLGDGSLMALLLIFLLFYNYYSSIITAFSIILQSIFISIFKRWLFQGLERPIAFFPEGIDLNVVDGVDIHSINTFPSGHTATGFALFAILFIVINQRGIILPAILFLLAFCVGFSRVYLLQHFIIDVYFGAIFGLLSVILGLYFMQLFFTNVYLEMLKQNSLRKTLKKK